MPSRSLCASRSSTSAAAVAGALLGAATAIALERRRTAGLEGAYRREAEARDAERALLADQLVRAEQDERRRLSLELHDGPLQSLSGIALMHDAALRALREGRGAEAETLLAASLDRQREAVQALRDLSFAIEPVVLRDRGFAAAVDALAEQVEAARGLTVTVDADAGESLGDGARVALYQTIREAVSQALRRSPQTVAVMVVRDAAGGVTATLADDGVEERRSGGLEALRERARILNARVALDTGPAGTVVTVEVPAYVAARRS